MLDVRKLRLLRELAHRGTIAAVADALAYTPSAVSQQLAALEREAGVPLPRPTRRRDAAQREPTAAVAAALAYPPSAVSQQLAALEREAGVPLLRRTGRRVALTPAGAALAEQTEAVLALLEQASAELAATRGGLT